MWIKSKENITVASTWGASVHLVANEPKQVGHDLALLCLQAGCEEVKEGVKEAPVAKEPVIEEEVVVEEEVAVEEESIDLESMTKVELEAHGRTIGIELDRRKKKSDLIEEIKAAE